LDALPGRFASLTLPDSFLDDHIGINNNQPQPPTRPVMLGMISCLPRVLQKIVRSLPNDFHGSGRIDEILVNNAMTYLVRRIFLYVT
jgi:hypothetical protein